MGHDQLAQSLRYCCVCRTSQPPTGVRPISRIHPIHPHSHLYGGRVLSLLLQHVGHHQRKVQLHLPEHAVADVVDAVADRGFLGLLNGRWGDLEC